jgi:hypothetical protein
MFLPLRARLALLSLPLRWCPRLTAGPRGPGPRLCTRIYLPPPRSPPLRPAPHFSPMLPSFPSSQTPVTPCGAALSGPPCANHAPLPLCPSGAISRPSTARLLAARAARLCPFSISRHDAAPRGRHSSLVLGPVQQQTVAVRVCQPRCPRPSPACACRCSAGSYWASAKDAAKPTQLFLRLRGRVGRLGPDWPISGKIGHVRVHKWAWG